MVTPQQLEAKVLAAVDALRRGSSVEDDYLEFKRDWPDPRRVRQLAGAANRASGNSLIWVIGVDESTGSIHPCGTQDPADWWAACGSRFDQVSPDLVHHLLVHVGRDESVVAMAFRTDRAPYVIKSQSGGSPELEVPIRDGTRTRSARRDELLRLLVPAASTPPAVVLSAGLRASWQAASPPTDHHQGIPESTSLHGSAEIFLEYVSEGFVMLPKHEMTASITSPVHSLPLQVRPWGHIRSKDSAQPPEPRFSVTSRAEGITATGPGTFRVQFDWTRKGDHRGLFDSERWDLQMEFPIAGAIRPLRLVAKLREHSGLQERGEFFQDVGEWRLNRASSPAD